MLTWVFHQMLFYPSRGDARAVERIGGVRAIYRTDDGLTLSSWMVPARGARRRASRASSIRAPLLHLHGDRDEVIPYALGEALQGRLPNARFVRVRGGTHNLADPGATRAMLDFVEEVVP